MKKRTKCLVFLTGAVMAGMYAYNRYISSSSEKNIITDEEGNYFSWKEGDIYYTVHGEGSPILLIHDLNNTSSTYEWNRIIKRLEKTHKVYAIDLLGCGRSDKPPITYTNYLYVQLITAFIDKVIKEKTSVIASSNACSFVIMAQSMNKDLFEEIILINPTSIKSTKVLPDALAKYKQMIPAIPLVGTFLYNLKNNQRIIDACFRIHYFKKPQLISSKMEDAFFESAHKGKCMGKFLYSSILCNYTNVDITKALQKADCPIHIIGSRNIKQNVDIFEQYHRLNNQIDISLISDCGLYPQLEIPEKLITIIKKFI